MTPCLAMLSTKAKDTREQRILIKGGALSKSLRSFTDQLQATSLANNVQEDTIKNLASELTEAKNQAKN